MKKIFILVAGFLLTAVNLYAGNGDLTVSGKVGIGTTTSPSQKLDVNGNIAMGGQAGWTSIGSTGATDSGPFIAFVGPTETIDTSRRGEIGIGGYGTNGKIRFFNFDPNAYTWNERMTILPNGNVGIGTSNPGDSKLYVNGKLFVNGPTWNLNGQWSYSDSKFKKDIQQIDSALDKVNNMTGVSYLYKTDEYKDKNFPDGKQLGVIAQELEKVIPEAVMTDEEGTKAVNYSEIIPVLIEAIKAQQKKIDDLQSTVTQLQSKSK